MAVLLNKALASTGLLCLLQHMCCSVSLFCGGRGGEILPLSPTPRPISALGHGCETALHRALAAVAKQKQKRRLPSKFFLTFAHARSSGAMCRPWLSDREEIERILELVLKYARRSAGGRGGRGACLAAVS